jgi:(p)ppGpp synthase/HD superfamily hydrolase
MRLGEVERARFVRAVELAADWHATQTRKGTEIPYLSHLIQVAGLVLEHGGDGDQAIAALLHDCLEDAATRPERQQRERILRAEFGEDVHRMVLDCTDTEEHEVRDDKAPWKVRKTRYLAHLLEVDERSALVAACDKRHNLGSLVGDIRADGPAIMERFSGENEAQVGYFEGVLDGVDGRIPKRLQQELEFLLGAFRALLLG